MVSSQETVEFINTWSTYAISFITQ